MLTLAGESDLCNITAAINGHNITKVTLNYYLGLAVTQAGDSSAVNSLRAPAAVYTPDLANSTLVLYKDCPGNRSPFNARVIVSKVSLIELCDKGRPAAWPMIDNKRYWVSSQLIDPSCIVNCSCS
jgi:hypothetical protein